MEGGGAWGFVKRALESMLLVESSDAYNFTSLHSAIHSCLDGIKEEKQQSSSAPVVEASKSECGSDKKKVESNKSVTTKHAAAHTFEEVEAGLVLSTLRLAFETKNITIVELALDCFHKLIAYDLLEGEPGLEGGKNAALFADFLNMTCGCVNTSSSDSTILQVLKVLTIAVTSTKFKVHGKPLLGVVRASYNVAVNSNSPINQATSKALLSQIISSTFHGMESDVGVKATMDKAVHLKNGDKIKQGPDLESMSIEQRDALLLFRMLCKMGIKGDNYEILSLELLQGLLEGVSHEFTKNIHFIDSVISDLSNALLRTSVSSSPVINQLAAGLFTVLLLRFREFLKVKIGIFFPLIVLRYLDNTESPPNLRLSVLRMLEKVCKDPQILVDIFVNYDCDPDAPNHFERMATTLSRIAQGTLTSDPKSVATPQLSAPVKVSSLQCLVNVLQSLIDWVKSHKDSYQMIKEVSSLDGCSGKDIVDKAKANESTAEAAISQCSWQPSKGLEYLISNKLEDSSPASVANFLKNISNVDKTMIGDYLGQHQELSLSAMHAYVDSMNFSGMTFAAAIREFLSGFRLPGEAKKIDSIMEKFAERYCVDNPALFKNADTAYALAYAVIMLNTDAHNPAVLAKLTKADFVRLNSMAEADETPRQELLEEIYDSIAKNEIKMKVNLSVVENSAKQNLKTQEKGSLLSILNLALPKSKSPSETKAEIGAIVKQTEAILRNKGTDKERFYTSHRVEVLKPMIEALGWPLLAAFSVIMEEGDYKSRIQLCMEGFKAGIHIAHVLEMDTLRNAFVTSLARSTSVHAPKEMRSKNVEALRTLLSLVESDVDALEDTWNAVLYCVSQIEFITSNPDVATTEMQALNQISRDSFLQSLRQLAGKHSEQVFLISVTLPSDAAVKFFTALCNVSAEELKQRPARVYSLYKLVEISFQNMARIRMVWARIWFVLANHFISAGSHNDEMVAMYAIDSLWRLGMKYLERAEHANFMFQNDILKPFVVLLRDNRSESRRKFIVGCIVQMIKSKVGRIKSGWRSVFIICTDAADDKSERIVRSAFEFVETVMWEHFDQVVGVCFMDCIKCLIGFAKSNSSHQISLKAIALLRTCEERLAEGLVPGVALKPIDLSPEENFDATEQFRLSMLSSLSDLTSDPRVEVRRCAVEVLFDLLNKRGSKFSTSFWETIFQRVLFPIFDHVRRSGEEAIVLSSDDQWLHEISVHSMQLLCNLLNTYYKEVSFMIPSLINFLVDCVKKTEESVGSTALGALVQLIEAGGRLFSDNDWNTLLKSIRDASHATQPHELLNKGVPVQSQTQTQGTVKFNSKEKVESQLPTAVRGKCVTQTLLLGVIDSIQKKYWSKLKAQQKATIMEILQSMLEFAASYNSCNNLQLRMGHISADRPPSNLLQQELAGTCVYLNILQKLTSELEISKENNSEVSGIPDSNTTLTNNHQNIAVCSNEDEELGRVAEEKLVSFCGRVLKEASEFLSAAGDTPNMEIHRVLELRSPIIVKVIEGIAAMNSQLFKKHLREFHPSLTKLASCDQMDFRGALNEVFKSQLSVLLP